MPAFSKLFSRKGTRSNFGSRKGKEPARTLPTYEQQDQETTPIDQSRKDQEDEAVDAQIDAQAGRAPEEDTKDVQPTKPLTKKKVTHNVIMNRTPGPSNTISKPSGAYQRLWSEVTDYTFQPRRFGTNAYFIPNAMALQRMLEIAVPLVARTNWIQKQESEFNPYAVAIGYFYMYYIQILRAKKAASDLLGQESSALTRFEKFNPLTSIPVPDFLIPFFSSIVATQLPDQKYKWIIPTWGFDDATANAPWPHYAGFADMATVTAADFIRPNIPFMLASLATFGSDSQTTMIEKFDTNGIYTPVPLTSTDNATPPVTTRRTALRFMNSTVNMTQNTLNGTPAVLLTCGASFPFQMWNDNWNYARRYIADSNFFVRGGINLVLSTANFTARTPTNQNPVAGGNMAESIALNSIDRYLFVAKENNPSWFGYIAEQMTIFAKHFPTGCVTFDDIPTTGGMESTIIGQLKLETALASGRTHFVYQNTSCGLTNNDVTYYPKLFRSLAGSFRTSRADVEREETYQALALAINSNPPILTNDNGLFRQGKFFTETADASHDVQYIGDMEQTLKGEVSMFNNWDVGYIRDVFVTKPTA